jgi:hypothetical protein
MKRIFILLAITAALTSAASTAVARTRAFDAKALARYDLSYAKCESLFPDMLGHRDEAYLNLWRIRSDDKSAARLAGVRSGAVYRSEKQLVLQGAAKGPAPTASSALKLECQGLWAENQRVAKDKR